MLSKGFIETIEDLWKEKNNEIKDLIESCESRDNVINILGSIIMERSGKKCIHEPGERERGHRYCDDNCPLVEISQNLSYVDKKPGNDVCIPLSLLCQRPKTWSK